MPSPLGHALGGLIVGLILAPPPPPPPPHEGHEGTNQIWRRFLRVPRILRVLGGFHVPRTWLPMLGWCVVVACLPDIDFAWGRHNMETHSLGFALLLGGATLAWERSARGALACTLAVSTHVLFDWLGSDDSPPLGVMALWPFSQQFYYADVWLFAAISRRYWLPWFVEQNTFAVLRELAILLPFVAVLWFYRRQTFQRGKPSDSGATPTAASKRPIDL